MNITLQTKEELTGIIKIEVGPSDYQGKVEKILKEQQKKAIVPGFRPGKVPLGMISKLYGKSIKVDEVYKIIENSLNSYMEDNLIDIVGQPMPYHEDEKGIDFENQENFEFSYEIGMRPPFELLLDKSVVVELPEIVMEDNLIDKYIHDITLRNGHLHAHEQAGEGDMIIGETYELDAEGQPLTDGIKHEAYMMMSFLNENGLKLFIGAKKGDEILYNPSASVKSKENIAILLKIEHPKAEALTSDYMFMVTGVNHMHPAELNVELFAKLYPDDNIQTLEEFRKKVGKEASMNYSGDCEIQFYYNAQKKLVSMTNLPLPEDFLRRFLLASNENKLTVAQLDKDFSAYLFSFRWQLIEQKIVRDYQIEVSSKEVRDFMKYSYLLPYFSGQEITPDLENNIDGMVESMLHKKEDAKKIYDKIFDQKLIELMHSILTVETKTYSYEEFVELISKNNYN